MTAPVTPRPDTFPQPTDPAVWVSGTGTDLRHAVRGWNPSRDGRTAALCGITSAFWCRERLGSGRVCPICVDRVVPTGGAS